jgi:hypothetical protein
MTNFSWLMRLESVHVQVLFTFPTDHRSMYIAISDQQFDSTFSDRRFDIYTDFFQQTLVRIVVLWCSARRNTLAPP